MIVYSFENKDINLRKVINILIRLNIPAIAETNKNRAESSHRSTDRKKQKQKNPSLVQNLLLTGTKSFLGRSLILTRAF